MPAMGGRGGGLMVPRGGMGRRSSCYPGGSGGMGVPSVHSNARRASSRSEAGIGLFPGLLGGGGSKNPKVSKLKCVWFGLSLSLKIQRVYNNMNDAYVYYTEI